MERVMVYFCGVLVVGMGIWLVLTQTHWVLEICGINYIILGSFLVGYCMNHQEVLKWPNRASDTSFTDSHPWIENIDEKGK